MSDMKEVYAVRFVKNLDAQLYEIISHIICPICQELLVNPVSTPCSHSFCCTCIRKVLSRKENCGCPLCKQPINNFSLQNDTVKEIFSRIFYELPYAFVNDVNGFLGSCFPETAPDLLKCSKLYQLFIQEDSVNKRKSSLGLNSFASVNNSDTKNLLSVYKCDKNIKKYKSMKEKRLNELISISQTEAFSPLNAFDQCELENELGKIEKVESCEKVQEWFETVGNDLFYSSPVPSVSNFNLTEGETKSNGFKEKTNTIKNETSTMIRVNYIKEPDASHVVSEANDKINPYAFIPSQSEQFGRAQGKGSFSRICRKNVALPRKSSAEKKNGTVDDVVTASRRFNSPITEHVKNKKKIDTKNYDVFLGQKLTSPKTDFLNVSDDSSSDTKSYSISMKLFKDCEKMKCTNEKPMKRKKRFRKELRSGGSASNNCFLEVLNMSSCDALELEKGMENQLKRREAEREEKKSDDDGSNKELTLLESTNLLCLLKEIIDDKVIYENYPSDTPIASAVRHSENSQDRNSKSFSGFGEMDGDEICQVLQNGSSDGKILKKIVATMEEELSFKEFPPRKSNRVEKVQSNEIVDPFEPMLKTDGEDSLKKIEKFNFEDNIRSENISVWSIIFVKCGRLTPITKRRKSSVVKVVFPVGLAAFGRRRKIPRPIGPSAPSFLLEESSDSCRRIIRDCEKIQCSSDTKTLQNFKSSVKMQTGYERGTVEIGVQTESEFWSPLQAPILDSPKRSQVSLELVERHSPETFSPENKSLSSSNLANTISTKIQSEFSTPQRRKRIFGTPSKSETNDLKKKFRENDLNEIQKRNPFFNPSKLRCIGVSMPCDRALPDMKTNLENTSAHKNCIEPKGNKVFSPEALASEKNNHSSESKNFAENSTKIQNKKKLENNFIPDSVDAVVKLIDGGELHSNREAKEIFFQNSDARESPPGANSDKFEESDSDFFVEQTPPRPKFSTHGELMRQKREKASARIAAKWSQNGRSMETNDRLSLHDEPLFHETCASSSLSNTNKKLTENQFFCGEIRQTMNNDISADLPAWKKFDFAPQKKVVSQEKKKFCVVASSVKNPDMVKKFASHFKMDYSNKPSKSMTHLVVGLHENEEGDVLPLCTPKLLFAMANNKWVVGEAWAEASLAANKVLEEENFETCDPVGGSACRESRLSTDKILKNCQICLLGTFENILKEELENLILDAGGTLISKPNHFFYSSSKLRIVIIDKECFNPNPKQIQDAYKKFQTVILSRDFIIMSIQSWKLSNFVPYMLHSASTKDLVDMGYPLPLVVPEESTIN